MISEKNSDFFLSLEIVILCYLTSYYLGFDARFVFFLKKTLDFLLKLTKRQVFQWDCNTVSDLVLSGE